MYWTMQKMSKYYNDEKNIIFLNLMDECQNLPPSAKLSYKMRNKLEALDVKDRMEIVNRVSGGCSPLFVVCRTGQKDVAEYLIKRCKADIEQRGIYEVANDRSTHMVTPLWCAAVSGKLELVELLLNSGANINAVSDTGSTPVRSACFMTYFDIVKYLVDHGADINQPNYNGGTCLINSVQSSPLCGFLLKNGADVNARDIQDKTALHYAIQEHRLETTKLLIKNGADVFAKSRYGDDALQMACLKGAVRIFDYLTKTIPYDPEKFADAHELLGSTFLEEHNDTSKALSYWKEALAIRETYGLFPKRPIMPPLESYRFQKEFESREDLDNVAGDLDSIRTQSLLITERVLGISHKDTIFRLMYRGASYADMLRQQLCINLWRRALEIRIKKDTILYTDTCFTAQALTRLMIDFNQRNVPSDEAEEDQRFRDVYTMFKLLTDDITEMRKLVHIRPVYKRQVDFFDKTLRCVTHLIFLMVEIATTDEHKRMMEEGVESLVGKNPRTISTEDTLLHLSVSQNNILRSSYYGNDEPLLIFPHYKVMNLLLHSGADVNAKNEAGATPLHIATNHIYNFVQWFIKLLLDYGAHIDQRNNVGWSAVGSIVAINRHQDIQIPVLNYLSLKCLCATAISKNRIKYKNQIPKTLEDFVRLHEPT